MPARCSFRISLPAPIRRTGCRSASSLPNAWHALFVRNMFIRAPPAELAQFRPASPFCTPELQADPARDGTRSGTSLCFNLAKRVVLIGGTKYAGEMKKSIFSVMNYLLPVAGRAAHALLRQHRGQRRHRAVLRPVRHREDHAVRRSQRQLIGDDEHGWSDRGVFNFEGGCYAKCIGSRPEKEPQIYARHPKFGTVLENVVLDPATGSSTSMPTRITENTRACLSRRVHPQPCVPGVGGHPKNDRLPGRRCLRSAAADCPL